MARKVPPILRGGIEPIERQAFEPPTDRRCMDICVILGSKSDLPIAEKCRTVLEQFDVSFEIRVASAHRAPKYLEGIVEGAESEGCKVFIGMAGVSAALPGVIASMTNKPVIGVPVGGKVPLDSLLSIVQMPPGMPVATVALGGWGARNSAVLAAQILGLKYDKIAEANKAYRQRLRER